ncbi:ABC transporter permease [Ochrobactrum sp. WV_118_8]
MSRHLINISVTVVALWIIAPLFVIILTSVNSEASFSFPPQGFSLRWYTNFLSDAGWLSAFYDTSIVAILTTIVATALGLLAALGLYRSNFYGKRAITGLLISPMIVPGILVAVGLYSVFTRFGLVGTLTGFVIAHTVVAIPLVVINVLSALSSFDPKLAQAAGSLGATPLTTFRKITLPLILPGVAAGAAFAFVTSFDEIIISLFIQSPFIQTLPVKMFQSVTFDSDPTVAAGAVLMMCISVGLASLTALIKRPAELKNDQ